MIADLLFHSGVDWYALDPERRTEAEAWWMMVRRYELRHLGAIGDDGRMRG